MSGGEVLVELPLHRLLVIAAVFAVLLVIVLVTARMLRTGRR